MKRLIAMIAGVALLMSMGVNLLMIRRVRQWKTLAETYSQELSPPLQAKMPPLQGTDDLQHSISFDVADTRESTVVFVFSSECGVCKRNWKNWDSLLASRYKNAWKPLFVNIGPPTSQDFRTFHSLNSVSLFDQASKDSVLAYRMYFTPETLIVSRDGLVTHAWAGVLTDEELTTIRKM